MTLTSDPQQASFLSDEELDALRTIIMYVKDMLHVTRAEIAGGAKVAAVDLDNFIAPRSRSTSGDKLEYKTKRPAAIFQKRILSFLLKDKNIRYSLENASVSNIISNAFNSIKESYIKISYDNIDDNLFNFLSVINVTSTNECKNLCKELSGNFYAYRLSANRKKIVKSFISINKYNIYQQVPYFENMRREEGVPTRITRGHVICINGNFIFIGFINNARGDRAGMKIIFMRQQGYIRSESLDGFYLSYDNDETYDFGGMRLERTLDKYKEENIGLIEFDQINFDVEKMAIDLSNVRGGNLSEAIIDSKLISSINFDIKTRK